MGQLSKVFERKIVIIFLSVSLNICFGCSNEPSHRDGSFEYPQHMFSLRNKKNNFNWGPESLFLQKVFYGVLKAHCNVLQSYLVRVEFLQTQVQKKMLEVRNLTFICSLSKKKISHQSKKRI